MTWEQPLTFTVLLKNYINQQNPPPEVRKAPKIPSTSFWKYWLVGGLIWIYERILREVRLRHRTYISEVIRPPSQVIGVQIMKEKTKVRAGQYIVLNCPEVSYFQWHPFTLTSAPEDYISVRIRIVGDFTGALAKAPGCDFDSEKGKKGNDEKGGKIIGTVTTPPLSRSRHRVTVDGPSGGAREDFWIPLRIQYETVLSRGRYWRDTLRLHPQVDLVPHEQLEQLQAHSLSEVYFVWVIRDLSSAERFHSLLHPTEEQDVGGRIKISIYLTAKLKDDEVNNIVVQDAGAEKDAITSLRALTHFGRPNWDRVFRGIAERHPKTDVDVFSCGPPVRPRTLESMFKKYTDPKGTKFVFGTENF